MKLYAILWLLLLHPAWAEKKVDFNQEVRPILSDKCYFCHGPDAGDIQGDLQLHTFEHATSDRGGAGGAIVPGNVEKSLLWHRITSTDTEKIMPPQKRHMALTETEKQTLKTWIEQGAEYDKHWSFKPLPKKVAVPQSGNGEKSNEVDHFVQKILQNKGLEPSAKASSDLLLRRLYITLTGLAPTLEQIAEFKADKSEDKYEKWVDKLLETQAFAERLAVDWMDLARYADSYGYQTDKPREVWLWRDWVLRSLKANMPYDEFLTQQLAGDLMPNSDDQMKLATAFNRLHMQKNEGGSVPEEFRTEYVADRAQTATTAFMGLTLECCRCHDHKYDPISMKEYYSTYAFFNNIDEAGVYSYFTKSTPSPSMAVMTAVEKVELGEKMKAYLTALSARDSVPKTEQKAFEKWKKAWDGKVKVMGKIGEFTFDSADNGKFPNAVNAKQGGSYNTNYSKVVDGQKGKAMLLDGDSALNFGKIGPYERHLDFSLSLKVHAAKKYDRAVILHRTRAWLDAASRGYELLVDQGKLSFALVHFSPGNEIRVRSLKELPVDQWQQITVTYDGSSKAAGIKLYLNGEILKTEVVKDNLTKHIFYKGGMDLQIGARFRDRGFKEGMVDELRVFNRRLTAVEIFENYQPGKIAQNDEELFDYFSSTVSASYQKYDTELKAKRKSLNKFQDTRSQMMIMKELPERRRTYLLARGDYTSPVKSEEIEPSPPSEIFPFGEEYSRDRLGLSQWLTHPEHPLTSRVTVNRYWQMIFGTGLVSTTNDFGSQGDFPSHPQLLDYLSRYFISSGWDTRAVIKKMVMSHTYRQDSNMTSDSHLTDHDNKWLSRGPSYYLTAEMIRDNALHSAGLINHTLGGKSVNPNRPKNNQYRRSLYTNWKRNAPSPEMLIFGAPRRQVCSVKREKTSTPLQPLVLMNSPQFVESSRHIAKNIMTLELEDDGKIKSLFLRMTGREPTKEEVAVLTDLLTEQRAYFKQFPKIAGELIKVGKTVTNIADKSELAAWTIVVNTVMNLDSFYMLR